MDRLISEKQVIDTIKTWATPLQISNSETIEDLWVNGVCELIKAIPSADVDLKQSFKDGYDTALNDLEDRFEALLNNNPWYANAISDILQIINEQKGSD